MATERVHVRRFVIGCAILPTAKQNPDPFVGERSQRRVMIIAAPTLLVVVRSRPLRKANGLIREFVKALLDEFWTGQPMVHPERLATPFGHGRNPRMGLELRRGLPPGPIRPERRGQARRTDVAGARKTGEDVVIGMRAKTSAMRWSNVWIAAISARSCVA